jgi:tetratricopeptide (TPR) repeat protein
MSMTNSMIRTATIAIYILTIVNAAIAQTPNPANKQVKANIALGIGYYQDRKLTIALESFEKALKLDPGNTVAELYRGATYALLINSGIQDRKNSENAARAVASFQKVLAKDPNNLPALVGMGSIYFVTHDISRSIEYNLRAAKRDYRNPEAFSVVGYLDLILVQDASSSLSPAEKAKRIAEGLANFDKALALDATLADEMTFKSLLTLEKAKLAADPAEVSQLTDKAAQLKNHALDLRQTYSQSLRGRDRSVQMPDGVILSFSGPALVAPTPPTSFPVFGIP